MTLALYETWWPVALSEHVTALKPIGVECAGKKVVIYRDGTATLRALDDRCPHRRVPLSMGRMTPAGDVQCGYHGWVMDGASGELKEVPNLDEGDRIPKCAVAVYPIAERNGFVYVWFGSSDADEGLLPESITQPLQAARHQFSGSGVLPLAHSEFIEAFLDAPELFMVLRGVALNGMALGDPELLGTKVVSRRIAEWNWLGVSVFDLGPRRHRADYPLSVTLTADSVTGYTVLVLESLMGEPIVEVHIASVPVARGCTAVNWRATVFTDVAGKGAATISALAALKCAPFKLLSAISGRSLVAALPGPASKLWREQLTSQNAPLDDVSSIIATA